MRTVESLIAEVEREARRAEFPIDTPVYERAGRDPLVPILYAGSLAAPVCSVGRDLGKDEVAAGEPQIGAAGRLVRAARWRDSRRAYGPAAYTGRVRGDQRERRGAPLFLRSR